MAEAQAEEAEAIEVTEVGVASGLTEGIDDKTPRAGRSGRPGRWFLRPGNRVAAERRIRV